MKQTKKKLVALLAVACCLCALLLGLFFLFESKPHTVAQAEEESGLRFTLYNDNAEYKVSAANRTMTKAVIPAYYNGLPVTEISDNAFMSCASLQNAVIPQTVTRVGNNAFANCRALEKLTGMINVTEIGNNAFAMCAQLNRLIIPPKVEKLGSYIIRNVTCPVYVRSTQAAFAALNANWNANSTAQIIYGNDLACSPVEDASGSVYAYSIVSGQNISDGIDYELRCSYKYKECNGQECFDAECANPHTETYYPITNIENGAFCFGAFRSLTLKYDDEHISERYPLNICSDAFCGVETESIDFQVDITLNDPDSDFESYPDCEKGTSTNVFAGASIQSITLPDSLTRIPRGMFSGCARLQHIYNANPYVAANTLSNKIVAIDTEAFKECTSLQVLNVHAGVQNIGNAAFDYWGSKEVKQILNIDLYKSGDLWDLNWTGEILQNAAVRFNTMPVVFERQGGEGGSDNVEVMYGQAMPQAAAPERTGYTFHGYYTQPNGKGERYYDEEMNSVKNWDIVSIATILYADWTPNVYTVLLADGVTVQAAFGKAMPAAPLPELEKGFIFEGYAGPDGTQYYDSDMTSLHVWDIAANNVQLTVMKVQFLTTLYLKDGERVYVTYGQEMPEAPMPAHVPGRVFEGYSYNGTMYYNADMTSAHVWDVEEQFVVLVYESRELVTSITYVLNGGTNASSNKNTISYSEDFVLSAPQKRGYFFDGWYLNGKKVTNIRNIDQENITLEAKWIGRLVRVGSTDSLFNVSDTPCVIFEVPMEMYNNCTINIATNVKQVYIYSRVYRKTPLPININITYRNTDFKVILENVSLKPNYTGSVPEPTISMRTGNKSVLYLETFGTVYIEGGQGVTASGSGYKGGDGGTTIQCSKLFITCEYLTIYGGRGGSGINGAQGGTSGYAIVVDIPSAEIADDELYPITMPSKDSLKIYSGLVGNFEASNRAPYNISVSYIKKY